MIHKMARTYGRRPSEILFPGKLTSNVRVAIDTLIFQVGYEIEEQERLEEKKAEMEYYAKLVKAIFGAR
jgi:hypothetical protein